MKKCKNQLLAVLIASTMAMSMTACSGTPAETVKPTEGNRKWIRDRDSRGKRV